MSQKEVKCGHCGETSYDYYCDKPACPESVDPHDKGVFVTIQIGSSQVQLQYCTMCHAFSDLPVALEERIKEAYMGREILDKLKEEWDAALAEEDDDAYDHLD